MGRGPSILAVLQQRIFKRSLLTSWPTPLVMESTTNNLNDDFAERDDSEERDLGLIYGHDFGIEKDPEDEEFSLKIEEAIDNDEDSLSQGVDLMGSTACDPADLNVISSMKVEVFSSGKKNWKELFESTASKDVVRNADVLLKLRSFTWRAAIDWLLSHESCPSSYKENIGTPEGKIMRNEESGLHSCLVVFSNF